jgi:glucuronokinase
MLISTKAHARAGLVGNPSDGYNGKTISIIIRDFAAEVLLYETPELEIMPRAQDRSRFANMKDLVDDVSLNGYYGGVRLIKATIARFFRYCQMQNIKLEDKNFTIRYNTNIPRQVGLAGSSAIITATLRALMAFYQVEIPKPIQPNLILSVETEELDITAGLQDRVIQVYENIVYMDFDKKHFEKQNYGHYEYIDPCLLPPIYIAYKHKLSKVSGRVHSSLKTRYERGEKKVIEGIEYIANLAKEARDCLLAGQKDKLKDILNANFDKRREIMDISPSNLEMIETARKCGASSKFCGSGGSIIGTYEDDDMYWRLVGSLSEIDVKVIRPFITERC